MGAAALRHAFIANLAYTYWLDLSRDELSLAGRHCDLVSSPYFSTGNSAVRSSILRVFTTSRALFRDRSVSDNGAHDVQGNHADQRGFAEFGPVGDENHTCSLRSMAARLSGHFFQRHGHRQRLGCSEKSIPAVSQNHFTELQRADGIFRPWDRSKLRVCGR